MRHRFFIFCIAAGLVVGSAMTADAMTVNGRSLDGQSYGVTLFSSIGGMQDGRVIFIGDRARVYLSNGMLVTLRLQNDDVRDTNFITATGFDGQKYRLQLKGSLPGFGPTGDMGGTRPSFPDPR